MRVTVNSPEHNQYHDKQMFVLWTTFNVNSIGERCTWYHLSFDQNAAYCDIYLSQDQITLPENSIKILCVLQNAYSDSQRLKAFPFFRVNPRNKSGKRMIKICGEDNDMWFSNVCPDIYYNPKDKGKTDLEHLKSVLKAQDYDLYIVCGTQAEEAVNKVLKQIKKPIIFMPHPASRSLTNHLCFGVQNYIESKGFDRTDIMKFKQLKGTYEAQIPYKKSIK